MPAAPIHPSQLSASPQLSFSGSIQSALTLARWHLLEFLQRGIDRVPRMAADGVRDRLRVELARVVKAGRGNRNQFRRCDECQIDRRSTGGAEGVALFVPAVARYPPDVRLARNAYQRAGGRSDRIHAPCHFVSGNRGIGSGSRKWVHCSFHSGSSRTRIRRYRSWSLSLSHWQTC